jgi:hypothetical protein
MLALTRVLYGNPLLVHLMPTYISLCKKNTVIEYIAPLFQIVNRFNFVPSQTSLVLINLIENIQMFTPTK